MKHARPSTLDPTTPRLKLHLRELTIRGRSLRVITLRPGTRAAFSTNRFHDTWHLVSDVVGAQLLARLLWGLAYQRRSGTLVLIEGEHLRPTPFDADPSDPIALCNVDLGRPDAETLRRLRLELFRRAPRPTCTIRWQTFGLDRLTDPREELERTGVLPTPYDPAWTRESMERRGGVVCYAAPAVVLRQAAAWIGRLDPQGFGMDYTYLAESPRCWGADGEVQVFRDYTRRVSIAAEARREVLASQQPRSPQDLRERVWRRAQIVAGRRRRDGLRRIKARAARADRGRPDGSRPSATASGPRR